MITKPEISIVIPVYNTSSYIIECYKSIKNQSFSNFEIIFIDDGSTDDSINIVRQISMTDNRVRIYSQENKGQAVARNVGIQHSKGQYIVFIDSDDWLFDNESLLYMYRKIVESKADFIQCSFMFVNKTRTKAYKIDDSRVKTGKNILIDTLLVKNLYTSPWAKIYNRQFLINNNLFFPEGLVNEDTAYSILCSAVASKVDFVSNIVYCSRERIGSTSRTSFKRMFLSMHKVLEIVHSKLIKSNNYNEDIKNLFFARYERSMLYNLLQSAQRCKYSVFKSDYDYCIEETNFTLYYKFIKFLPLPHKSLCILSKNSYLFFITVNLIKHIGFKMH